MFGYYMYKSYLLVPVGQIREQIELNKQLLEINLLEQHTGWNVLMCHVPNNENMDCCCDRGCCKY
jgi:hypothetical protein